jgi:hypothetical protein
LWTALCREFVANYLAETIRSDFTSWYNAARVDLRKSAQLKVELKKYLSKAEYKKLKLDSPPTHPTFSRMPKR